VGRFFRKENMYYLLADADSAAAGAGVAGLAGMMLLVWLAFAIYAIMAFFVPIYIYKTMRRSTQILEEIRAWRAAVTSTPMQAPAALPAKTLDLQSGSGPKRLG
jgi:hypothetical protein